MGFARLVAVVLFWLAVMFAAVWVLGLFFGMIAAALLALVVSARNRSF